MSSNTARRIRVFMEEEVLDGDAAPEDLMAVGFLDSLAVEQMIAFVEETFGITFDDEDLVPENIASIEALAVLVDRKRDYGPSR
jgi:acyl carrier protein